LSLVAFSGVEFSCLLVLQDRFGYFLGQRDLFVDQLDLLFLERFQLVDQILDFAGVHAATVVEIAHKPLRSKQSGAAGGRHRRHPGDLLSVAAADILKGKKHDDVRPVPAYSRWAAPFLWRKDLFSRDWTFSLVQK